MTGRVVKSSIELKRTLKLHGHGGLRTKEEVRPIQESQEPFAMAPWFDNPASDAEKLSPLLITKIMTSRLMSCGFANRVTSKDTKKF